MRTDCIPHGPYAKWYGAHWVLATLADIGYPPGDASLIPLREQEYAWLLSEKHEKAIRTLQGRVRRCASQEAYAVFALLTLGLADSRTEELVERLLRWQWPDGGWNCDKRPEAINSSFSETLIPLRGLALHARLTGDARSREAAARAAEVFLQRRLFKRRRDGQILAPDFIRLHYPCYWHYDILFALKVMAEAGFIRDERCADALDLLESKRLPDGGFPAEFKYYRVAETARELRIARGLGRHERQADERIRDGRGAGRAQGRRSIATRCRRYRFIDSAIARLTPLVDGT